MTNPTQGDKRKAEAYVLSDPYGETISRPEDFVYRTAARVGKKAEADPDVPGVPDDAQDDPYGQTAPLPEDFVDDAPEAAGAEAPKKSRRFWLTALIVAAAVILAFVLGFVLSSTLRGGEKAPAPSAEAQEKPAAAPVSYRGSSEDWEYTVRRDGTVLITKYTGRGETLVIPEAIDGYPVTEIGEAAFKSNQSLTAVTVGRTVSAIGDEAFRWCASLRSVTLGDAVRRIGAGAFDGCGKLKEFTFGLNPVDFGANPFCQCISLREITIPAGNTDLQFIDGMLISRHDGRLVCALQGLVKKEYVVPDYVRVIGGSAFTSCGKATRILLPEGITAIGEAAFQNCFSLERINLSGTVTSVAADAFSGCEKLTILSDNPAVIQYCRENGIPCTGG